MNKKLLATIGVVALTLGAFAAPRPGPRPMRRPPPPPRAVHHGHHHHHHAGSSLAAGLVGGFVGGLVYNAVAADPVVVVQQPTVVQQPVVVQQTTVQNVWVEGRYIEQVQPNGTVIRVWQPGHYEQRTIVVQ